MVLGTTSGAGKNWLTTALCRWYARQELRVAPFKAHNMSNKARVVAPTAHNQGGEIGSAQYFQALAARAVPEVRMNPLLLKSERDMHSQVVLMGQVNDVAVIEGAGSPAEINLMVSDIVNLRVARQAQARCLLVTDIDRGSAFVHLYGTWALMPEADLALLHGFVLNKFRGDASPLAPAPEQLLELTGVPTVATLPMWWSHGLPAEDGVFDTAEFGSGKTVVVVAYPRISNPDEFQPLKNVPSVRLRWARTSNELADADWIVLPGSEHTSGDLAWLRAQGIDCAIVAHAVRDRADAQLGVRRAGRLHRHPFRCGRTALADRLTD